MTTSEKNWEEELNDPANWTKEDEVFLLYCTLDNKPVGINKHLQMSIIWSRFRALTKKNVSSDVLWKKLGSWYNLKRLDEKEPLPFQGDKDFLLPCEIIPDCYIKLLSEEEKKSIDFSEQFKKFIAVPEPDEDDYKNRLRGSEKMKWFESSLTSKTAERTFKKMESKAKFDSNESSNDSSLELKPLRKYGKAADITSGSMLTISVPPQLLDELDDTTGDDDNCREDILSTKQSNDDVKEDSEKSRKRKRPLSKRGDPPDDEEGPAPKIIARGNRIVDSPITTNTRLRKSSVASHEASSGTETEKESNTNEDNLRVRRRCSTRVSTSESASKSETTKLESGTKNLDNKRKSMARR